MFVPTLYGNKQETIIYSAIVFGLEVVDVGTRTYVQLYGVSYPPPGLCSDRGE